MGDRRDRSQSESGQGIFNRLEHAAGKYYENVHDRIRDAVPGEEPLGNQNSRSSRSSRAASRDRYGDRYRRPTSEPDGHYHDFGYDGTGRESRVRWDSDRRQPGDDLSSDDGSDDERRRHRHHRRRRRKSNPSNDYLVEEGRHRRRNSESMGSGILGGSTVSGGYDATREPFNKPHLNDPNGIFFPPPPQFLEQKATGSEVPPQQPYAAPPTQPLAPAAPYAPAASISTTSPPYAPANAAWTQPQPSTIGMVPPPPLQPTPPQPRSPSPSKRARPPKNADRKPGMPQNEHHMMASVAGAVAGGFLGHQAGKGDVITTATGAILGLLGANLAEEQVMRRKDKIKDKIGAYAGAAGGRSESTGGKGSGGSRKERERER